MALQKEEGKIDVYRILLGLGSSIILTLMIVSLNRSADNSLMLATVVANQAATNSTLKRIEDKQEKYIEQLVHHESDGHPQAVIQQVNQLEKRVDDHVKASKEHDLLMNR